MLSSTLTKRKRDLDGGDVASRPSADNDDVQLVGGRGRGGSSSSEGAREGLQQGAVVADCSEGEHLLCERGTSCDLAASKG